MSRTLLVEQRRNRARNPQALTGPGGWAVENFSGAASTGAHATGTTPVGESYYRATVTTGGANARVRAGTGTTGDNIGADVTAGQQYTASIHGRVSAARNIRPILLWYTAAGAYISQVNGTYVAATAGTWARLSVTGTAPANAVIGRVSFDVASVVAADTIDATGAQIETGPTATPYFDGDTDGGNPTVIGSTVYAWTSGALNAVSTQSLAVAAMTIVAAVEPSTGPGDPPRVRVDVDDAYDPPLDSVTVTRIGPDGRATPVRTDTGGPVVLSAGTGLVYDYEAPFGQPVTYATLEDPAIVSAQVTVDADEVWIIHPGVPAVSRPIPHFRPGSFQSETHGIDQGVFRPLGRATPVVVTGGVRQAPSGQFTVGASTPAEVKALQALLSDGSPLLFNCPASLGWDIDPFYFAPGEVTIARTIARKPTVPERDLQIPYQVVDRPGGGTQAERSYTDVLVGAASYAEVLANYPSYFDLLAGP